MNPRLSLDFGGFLPGGSIGGGLIGFPNPGVGSIGFPLPGTIQIGGSNNPRGSGSTGGSSGGSSIPGAVAGVAGRALSSVLGIPSINWGRLATFLLALLLIAGGLYLIKPVQQIVVKPIKRAAREAGEGIAAGAAA